MAARLRWSFLPPVVFLGLAAVSIAWLALDKAPLIFDPSAHLFSALYFDSFPDQYLSEERQFYPPLVHILTATVLALSGYNVDLAIGVVALSFLAIMLASTYGIGRRLWTPRVGALATIVLALYPATYIHARSLLLDLPLTAMVTLSVWMLLESRRFSDPAWSLAFGLSCAAGLLTKQMFAAAMVVPVAYELLRNPRRAPSLMAVGAALAPIAVVFAWWYAPRFDWFLGDYRMIQESYADTRGDTETLTWQGLTYYLRGTWHQTTLALAVVWVATLPFSLRAKNAGLLIAWWAGVVVTATALVLKDSRFLMPALPAIALMTAVGLDRLRHGTALLAVVGALGLVQLYAASFGSAWLPEGHVVTNRVEDDDSVQWFAQHWRMTAADSSVADRSGWGGAAAGLRELPQVRIGVVADRVVYVAARNPRLTGDGEGTSGSIVEQLTCDQRARFDEFDLIVVQLGGRAGVSLFDLAGCTSGLVEDHRIAIRVPRILPGVEQLIVYRTSP